MSQPTAFDLQKPKVEEPLLDQVVANPYSSKVTSTPDKHQVQIDYDYDSQEQKPQTGLMPIIDKGMPDVIDLSGVDGLFDLK